MLENHFRGIPCPLEEETRTLDGGEEKEKSKVSCWLKRAGRENKADILEGDPQCFSSKPLVLAALYPCSCNEECCIYFNSSCIS